MTIISIEGLTASGKSTLIKQFKFRYSRFHPEWCFLEEPQKEFSSFHQYDPLEEANKKIADVPVAQMHVIDVLENFYKQISTDKNQIYICERSLYTPKIFNDAFCKSGLISNFSCDYLDNKVDNALSSLKLNPLGSDRLFYLDAPLYICSRRVEAAEKCNYFMFLYYLEESYKKFRSHYSLEQPDNIYISKPTCDTSSLCNELYRFILNNE